MKKDKFDALAEKKGHLSLEELEQRKAERCERKQAIAKKHPHELARCWRSAGGVVNRRSVKIIPITTRLYYD